MARRPGSGFAGSVTCYISKASVGTNCYGERTYDAPKKASCSIIDLQFGPEKTTRRADSGATRGFATEIVVSKGFIQLGVDADIALNDKITIRDEDFRVVSLNRKENANGCVAHILTELEIFRTP